MRLARAVSVLAMGPFLACVSPGRPGVRPCSGPSIPAVPPYSEIHLGNVVDTADARRGLAQLVFHVRSAGPTEPGRVVTAYTVVMQGFLTGQLPPLDGVGDSSGIAVVSSVPLGYTSAQVQRIGYDSYTAPLMVRPGHSDTIRVALAEATSCLAP